MNQTVTLPADLLQRQAEVTLTGCNIMNIFPEF